MEDKDKDFYVLKIPKKELPLIKSKWHKYEGFLKITENNDIEVTYPILVSTDKTDINEAKKIVDDLK